MKKYGILFGLALILLASGCKKEEALEPSNLDRNWYEIKNNPSDPLQSLLYDVYQQYGVSLLTSNILGEVERTNEFGQTYTHQEVLSYNYNFGPGGQWHVDNKITYAAAADNANLKLCAEALRDLVIPKLKKHGICPRAFMLAKKMAITYSAQLYVGQYTVSSWDYEMEPMVFKTVNASLVAAGKINQVSKEEFALRVMAEEYKAVFRKEYPDDYAAFIALVETNKHPGLYSSYSDWFWASDFDDFCASYGYLYGMDFDEYYLEDSGFNPRKYGFLQDLYDTGWGTLLFPNEDMDISEFIYQALTKTKAEFDTAYASYTAAKNKFAIIKKVVDAIGID